MSQKMLTLRAAAALQLVPGSLSCRGSRSYQKAKSLLPAIQHRQYNSRRSSLAAIQWLMERSNQSSPLIKDNEERPIKIRYADRFHSSNDPGAWMVEPGPLSVDPVEALATRDTIYILHPEHQDRMILHRHWLRDACPCPMCVDLHSGQKKFGTCDIPLQLPIKECRKTAEGDLEIVWENDFLTGGVENHVSRYPASMIDGFFGLKQYRTTTKLLQGTVLWDKEIFTRDQTPVHYDDWMAGTSSTGFLKGLNQIKTHGLLFLTNVPRSEDSVVRIANQIGNLQETFYGRTWDVRSKPNAENVAYTNAFLGLHQDLLYTDDPPRIQLLHCMDNSCEGGESLFSDAMRAGLMMKVGPRNDLFWNLQTRKVKYMYTKHGYFYEKDRVVLDGRMPRVWWSPPFQGGKQKLIGAKPGNYLYAQWVLAAKMFRELVEQEKWMYEYKMKEGECVIFDNLRVLHGRRQFDTSAGSRWLKGAYIASDVFRSKLVTLANQLRQISSEVDDEITLIDEQAKRFSGEYDGWRVDEMDKQHFSRRTVSRGRGNAVNPIDNQAAADSDFLKMMRETKYS